MLANMQQFKVINEDRCRFDSWSSSGQMFENKRLQERRQQWCKSLFQSQHEATHVNQVCSNSKLLYSVVILTVFPLSSPLEWIPVKAGLHISCIIRLSIGIPLHEYSLWIALTRGKVVVSSLCEDMYVGYVDQVHHVCRLYCHPTDPETVCWWTVITSVSQRICFRPSCGDYDVGTSTGQVWGIQCRRAW